MPINADRNKQRNRQSCNLTSAIRVISHWSIRGMGARRSKPSFMCKLTISIRYHSKKFENQLLNIFDQRRNLFNCHRSKSNSSIAPKTNQTPKDDKNYISRVLYRSHM